MRDKPWLLFAIITTITWGIWGALIEIPEKAGFPATLGYCVWALTMIPCAIVALKIAGWKIEHDLKSIRNGSIVGLLGAGGQLLLFQALRQGPAYIVFPIISLYPVVTITCSLIFLKERASRRGWWGISLALLAVLMLSYTMKPEGAVNEGFLWLFLAFGVSCAWGLQAFVMKVSTETMKAESVFFYMMFTAVALIPIALLMTDFDAKINWSFDGPYVTAMIQVLNSIGALMLIYAIRYGKAIVVVPMTALAPTITIILSLVIYAVIPNPVVIVGLFFAFIAIYLLAE